MRVSLSHLVGKRNLTSSGIHQSVRQLYAFSCTALIIFGSILLAMPMGKATISWATEVIDPRDTNYRSENSFVLDSLGRPHTVYHSSSALIYAVKDGGSWHYSTVESSIPVNSSTQNDLALDSSGTPYVAYRNYTHIWLAKSDGTYWYKSDVYDGQQIGRDVTIALNRSGYPRIAHIEGDSSNVTLYLSSLVGNLWAADPIESGYEAVAGPIAIDRNDRVHVSYWMNGAMKHAYYDGTGWNITTIFYAPSSTMAPGGLALDALGFPQVTFTQRIGPTARILYAGWNGTSWSLETVDCCVVDHSSLALDLRNEPHISYWNHSMLEESLIYAYKNGTSWAKESVEPCWGYTAIGVDAMMRVHIVYLEVDGHHVRYALRIPDNPLPVSRVRPVNPHWWNSVPLYLQVDATDLNGSVDRVDLYYRFDAGAGWGPWSQYVFSRSPPWIFPFGWPDGEGRYEFYSLAFDGLEWELKIEASEASAGYDITPPVSTALPISPYWHSTSPMSVDATATDNLSGVANVTLFYSYAPLDNSSWSAWTEFNTRYSPPWSWSFLFPNGKGNYKFHTIATDVAGNKEGAKTIAEAVAGYNGTPPIAMPDYAPINEQPIPPVRIGLSSPISLSLVVHNGGNATAETDTTLAFHNSTTPATPFKTFTINPIAPGGNSSKFTATWTSPTTSDTYLVSANVEYWNNVTEWNETNNVFTWTIDVVTGPITSLVIGSPNYTSSVMATFVKPTTSLDFSVLDQSGLGIRNTTYRIDGGSPVNYTATGTFSLSSEGEHYLEWFSEDYAGNVENASSLIIRVDGTAPTTTPLIGDPKYLNGNVFVNSSTSISLPAIDGGLLPVGLSYTGYSVDGGTWKIYSSPFNLTTEGLHTIDFFSSDRLLNLEAQKSIIVIVDNTPPDTSLQVNGPKFQSADLYVGNGIGFNLTAIDGGMNPVGLGMIEYRIDGGLWNVCSSDFTLASATDGPHAIDYRSKDLLGNVESVKSLQIILDNSPPATTIHQSEEQATTATVFTLTATDSGCGVNVTRYRIDGGSWITYSGGFTLPEGEHNISYYSNDMLNNTEAERWLLVTVEGTTTPPVEVTVNYKPVVAVMFAIILLVAGVWSSRRRPWKGGKERIAVVKAFMITSMSFVIAEAATGMVSFLTGQLSVPPLVGVGTAVDLTILLAGVVTAILRTVRTKPSGEGRSE
jgi:hypothetical protein